MKSSILISALALLCAVTAQGLNTAPKTNNTVASKTNQDPSRANPAGKQAPSPAIVSGKSENDFQYENDFDKPIKAGQVRKYEPTGEDFVSIGISPTRISKNVDGGDHLLVTNILVPKGSQSLGSDILLAGNWRRRLAISGSPMTRQKARKYCCTSPQMKDVCLVIQETQAGWFAVDPEVFERENANGRTPAYAYFKKSLPSGTKISFDGKVFQSDGRVANRVIDNGLGDNGITAHILREVGARDYKVDLLVLGTYTVHLVYDRSFDETVLRYRYPSEPIRYEFLVSGGSGKNPYLVDAVAYAKAVKE
jgi:hypothetical protein